VSKLPLGLKQQRGERKKSWLKPAQVAQQMREGAGY
jgi:hypothetical protein